MRPPVRPRAAGTARPRPADQGAADQRPAHQVPARPSAADGGSRDERGSDRRDRAASERRPGSRRAGAAPDEDARALRLPGGRPADATAGPTSAGRDDVVSDRLADRLAERTAMARYRALRRLGWTAAALVVVAGLVWVAFFSPLLALDPEQVRVTGQGTTVDVGQVRDAVTDEAGVPLPRLDTVGLREEILGMNAVKDVRIERVWPDGVTVTLTAREPVAAVPQPGGVYALMDAEGVRVATAEEVPDGLPAIMVSLSDGEAGHRAMGAALEVLGALPPRLAGDIRTVSAATQDDVRTTLSDGRVIRWGSGAQVELKTRVAQTLLRAEPSATTIDVSSPALPVTN